MVLAVVSYLEKIKGRRWDRRIWMAIHKLYPGVAIECVIVNDKNVLLTHRTGDWTGWHFPGSALNEGETIEACAVRCVLSEVGLKCLGVGGVIGVVNHPKSPRAHDVSLLVPCATIGKAVQQKEPMQWFAMDELREEDVITCHRRYLSALRAYVRTHKTILTSDDLSDSFV